MGIGEAVFMNDVEMRTLDAEKTSSRNVTLFLRGDITEVSKVGPEIVQLRELL
jgi:hypothetical protein